MNNKKKERNSVVLMIVLAVCGVGVLFLILPIIIFGAYFIACMMEKPLVVNDVKQYEKYIGEDSLEDEGTTRLPAFEVFPEHPTVEGDVLDFQYMYYNPWDGQNLAYLTVQYSPMEYQKELYRLQKLGVEDYETIYSVTGEPAGYDLVAMDSDAYKGFCYAMVPENQDNTITYVGIQFCNYFLDVDVNDYIPPQYLLEGFDATADNPYQLAHKNQ